MERPGEAVREGSPEEAGKTEGSRTWQGGKRVQESYIHLFSGMAGSPMPLHFHVPLCSPLVGCCLWGRIESDTTEVT